MSSNTTPVIPRKDDRAVNLAALRKASAEWQQGDDVFSRLCRRMSTSLSLEKLISIFASELATAVAFDHLVYRHQIGSRELVYTSGLGGPHSCDYRLNLEGIHYGGLTLSRRKRFEAEELKFIEQLIGVAICPIRNACEYETVKQAALTDALTQVPNKRALDEALARACHLADRHGETYTLILCDLDHFKQVNDTHGHIIGDHILQATATEMGRAIRNSDGLYRYGGEEFAVLLPHADEAEARQVADRIRDFISDLNVNCGEANVTVTASAGIARRLPGETPSQWLARSDEALYRAKHHGRNRTRVALGIPAGVK